MDEKNSVHPAWVVLTLCMNLECVGVAVVALLSFPPDHSIHRMGTEKVPESDWSIKETGLNPHACMPTCRTRIMPLHSIRRGRTG